MRRTFYVHNPCTWNKVQIAIIIVLKSIYIYDFVSENRALLIEHEEGLLWNKFFGNILFYVLGSFHWIGGVAGVI